MSRPRQQTSIDRVVAGADRVLKTLVPRTVRAQRPRPGADQPPVDLDDRERRHIAGLMRVNHTGEVCAQALYQGQALTARLTTVRASMDQSAEEEIDHLAWCEERLAELDSRPSVLNPLFYALSFGLGATAGAVGDRVSLGFVAATEDQVCKHLREHLEEVPADDLRTRAILEEMLEDEAAHATKAHTAGALQFPGPVKELMTRASRLMTRTAYRV